MRRAEGELSAETILSTNKQKNMGDRSPKSNQKQAKQKQDKNASANQKKQQAAAAKQGPKK